ncbi:type I restriction modification DNA specificity protein [Desulfitobacterium dichloroeliminans LMG P-21439]|uniref:Type I restriction modification DNA specificity protein n=1 Tax=Desulfitobacterium dichloroeliminans (strain LMG P-21439 / DCA1) TaxID=871963 RepID=L0F6Y1_DESDL|nr:restriction endonuclease subunit S [Desulfitobacterium dichloroeliminans]AGA68947.1 type I restriction modification DNA specificity protein [Desulfitobacterium dichloroeliminans LMG P-21439]
MKKLEDVVEFMSGSPQFRIEEAFDDKAPLYTYYGQLDIEEDLVGIASNGSDSKRVRTFNKVNTLCKGDVVFSLISGKSTTVAANHKGYLYTQNYVRLVTVKNIDSKFLVYLLNEDKSIKKQLQMGLQGSQVLKYTLKQLKELELPDLPTLEKQRIIGELYFNQLRLEALRNRAANLETTIVLEKLREVSE